SCDDVEKGVKGDYLPPSSGATGEVLLVMDTSKWNTPLGEELRTIFYEPMPGLLAREPRFDMKKIQATSMNEVLRRHKNIIYLISLEGKSKASKRLKAMLSEETIGQIKENPEVFMRVRDDVHAKGQKVLYLFADTDEQLTKHLEQANIQVRDVFEQAERKRMLKEMYGKSTQKAVEKSIKVKHGATIAVPFDYDIVKNIVSDSVVGNGFAHIRRIDNTLGIDRNFFFAYKPYTSEEQLNPLNIIEWRDSICQYNIFDIEKPELFVTTEMQAPADPKFKRETFQDRYALEVRGLWRYSTQIAGGVFVSYVVVDERSGRLYYMEGFVYAPGRDKRELIRELETGLWAFEF
ncbi:MAG: DUF4837 family protein, partial [Bacteroidota bacterium]